MDRDSNRPTPLDYASPAAPCRRRSGLAMVAAGLVLLALSAGIGLVAFVKFSHIGPDVVWRAYPRLSFAALFAAPGLGAILGVAALLQITEHRATLKGIPIAIAAIVVGSVLAVIGFGLSLDFTM